MGNSLNVKKASFEDVQHFINEQKARSGAVFMINVLSDVDQACLIPHTVAARDETALINSIIDSKRIKQVRFIIYGKNSSDSKLQEQYMKLYNLGFTDAQLFIYLGGMFEWLLLQDIYGEDEFPTTTREIDLLKYKPVKALL